MTIVDRRITVIACFILLELSTVFGGIFMQKWGQKKRKSVKVRRCEGKKSEGGVCGGVCNEMDF